MYWIETVYIKRNEMPLIIRRQKKKKKKNKNAILFNYRHRLFYFSDYKLNDYLFILFECFKN